MRLSVLALDGIFDTGLTVVLDAFRLANLFSTLHMGGTPRFDVSVVGVRKRIRSGQGFVIPVQPMTSGPKPDWVIVTAFSAGTPEMLIPALERPDVRRAQAELQKLRSKNARIGASCNGTFILAEAGLLDGQEATTTWWLGPLFRQRYPNVKLDEARMLVPSEIGVTAGAAIGHLDLALWLIRQSSPDLSAVVSRYLLSDIRSSQAPYIIASHLAQADPLIQQFERWSRDHLKSGFSLQEAAGALATSARTLQRRCEAVLGKSPLSYFQDLRVERAKALLQGGLDLDAIATEVGYVDGATLRTLLRQRLGRGVRELRAELH